MKKCGSPTGVVMIHSPGGVRSAFAAIRATMSSWSRASPRSTAARETCGEVQHVRMGIDETRHHRGAVDVDHARAGAPQASHLLLGSARHDPPVADHERLLRGRAVHRVHAPTDEQGALGHGGNLA